MRRHAQPRPSGQLVNRLRDIRNSESESESALFAKCAQIHKEFVVVFKKLLVHTCIHTYIHTYLT